MSYIQHSEHVFLRTRANNYLNTDHGTGPEVKMVTDFNPDPAVSDEVWSILKINGNGVIQHGDPILLQTRANYYLNTDHGTGPEVKMVTDFNPNPAVSDEVWSILKINGNGAIQHGDPILLQTRANYYLNTDHGTGPQVKMVTDFNPDPAVSDEIWFIERIEDAVTHKHELITKVKDIPLIWGFTVSVEVWTDELSMKIYFAGQEVGSETIKQTPSENEITWSRELAGQKYKLVFRRSNKSLTVRGKYSVFNQTIGRFDPITIVSW
ncbi:hypothetical protein [Bacillus toyonensis]|uniref:hypothetical protein n=1 Tax=Bacillus toyonensis TaxID=155322 RepID=UPI000BF1B2BE|nr:hypothetical protein [Bacillus toyonensis]PEI93893.1 hypothetical protein CN671_30485 [Bacillus toyonensis]